MKKYFYSLFAAVAMMFAATSCSQEEIADNSANSVEATFDVALEGQIDSRAIADGKTVDQLIFAVFDEDGKEISNLRQSDVVVKDGSATVKARFVKGQSYYCVFWAQVAGADHYDTSDMKNIKVKNYTTIANDETRDAFYAKIGFKVTAGFFNKDVILKRPFAQLNLGTTLRDWVWATTAGVTIEKSKVSIKGGIYTQFDTFKGDVAGEPIADAVEFELNKIPNMDDEDLVILEKIEDDVDIHTYEYLSTSYLLAPAEKTLTSEIIFTLNDENDEINKLYVYNAPLQQNWRTNIVGDILTGEGTFNIVVDPTFDGERNYWMENSILILPTDGTVNGDVSISQNKDQLGAPDGDVFLIKDQKLTGTITIDESPISTGVIYFQNVEFEKEIILKDYVTLCFENVKFLPNQPILLQTGLLTHQIMLHNCYVGDVKITNANKNTYFPGFGSVLFF